MIGAAALVVALADPQRDVLIDRWLRANRAHAAIRLSDGPRSYAAMHGAPDLRELAAREFEIPGRYQIDEPQALAQEPWWIRPWRWLGDRWQAIWRRLFSGVHVGREAAADIGDVLLVILGLLVLFVAFRLLVNLQLVRVAPASDAAALEAAPSSRALYRAACAAAARGAYGTGVLLLFSATVQLLERRGDIRPSASATVGELRRQLRKSNGSMLPPFDAIAGLFVQRAFAERRIDEAQWESARATYERYLVPAQQAIGE